VRRQILFLALLLPLPGSIALAQSPDPSGASPQASPSPAPAKPAANPDAQAKPPAKPHKVYTNEDFDARPHDVVVEGGRDLLQALNTCDRACFDQVAQRANASGAYSSRWKLALLDAVDTVKADSAWQGILGEILGVQANACELQVKKTQDLQQLSDPRTVTPAELLVEREYEPKFRDIQNRLNALLNRANAHIAKATQSVVQSSYMQLQVDKLVHATCRISVPRPPDDTDDPDDP
jgi:hypothetical protein